MEINVTLRRALANRVASASIQINNEPKSPFAFRDIHNTLWINARQSLCLRQMQEKLQIPVSSVGPDCGFFHTLGILDERASFQTNLRITPGMALRALKH